MRKFNFVPSARPFALARQRFGCACCGEALADQLDFRHHVIPNQVGRPHDPLDRFLTTQDNCVMLCEPCHGRVHVDDQWDSGAVAPPTYFPFSHGADGTGHQNWCGLIESHWDRIFPSFAESGLSNPLDNGSQNYGFNDLYKSAHGRDMTSHEKQSLFSSTLNQVNQQVMDWAIRTNGDYKCFESRGDSGEVFMSFTRNCIPPTKVTDWIYQNPNDVSSSQRAGIFSSILSPQDQYSRRSVEALERSSFGAWVDESRARASHGVEIQIASTASAYATSSSPDWLHMRVESVRNGRAIPIYEVTATNVSNPQDLQVKAYTARDVDYFLRPIDKNDGPRYAGH